MSNSRQMKKLVTELSDRASQFLDRPTEPKVLMQALCEVMSERLDRPVELYFRPFPDGLRTSGLKIDFLDSTKIIVEERHTPEHQLLILGHELWHLEKGDCGHHTPTTAAAARMIRAEDADWDQVLTVAARAASHDQNESAAETFGLLVRSRFQCWMHGPHARGPVNQATVEGRITTALDPRATGLN